MDARLAPRLRWIPHSFFASKPVRTFPETTTRVRTLVAQAAWFAFAGAWLELAIILGHRGLVGTVTNVSVWFSRYHLAMGIAASLAIATTTLVLAVLLPGRWLRPSVRDLAIARFGLFLALASPLLAIEELHWAGSLALATGMALRIGPLWLRVRGPVLRRSLLPLVTCSVLAAGLSAVWVATAERRAIAALPPSSANAPNVIMIVMDTVRADHLSLYGYGRRTTPNLKALARRGICFDFARSASPWTLPSHASMFTGMWPHELSAGIDRPLDRSYPTLAENLTTKGYATGGFAANAFYCNRWFGVDRGFARYEDADENQEISIQQTLRCAALTRVLMPAAVWAGIWPNTGQYARHKTALRVNRDALAWVDQRKARPFFLFLNYLDAHGPYILPNEFSRVYSKASRAELMEANRKARFGGDTARSAPDHRKSELVSFAQTVLDAYDDCIRYLDHQIGQLVADLER